MNNLLLLLLLTCSFGSIAGSLNITDGIVSVNSYMVKTNWEWVRVDPESSPEARKGLHVLKRYMSFGVGGRVEAYRATNKDNGHMYLLVSASKESNGFTSLIYNIYNSDTGNGVRRDAMKANECAPTSQRDCAKLFARGLEGLFRDHYPNKYKLSTVQKNSEIAGDALKYLLEDHYGEELNRTQFRITSSKHHARSELFMFHAKVTVGYNKYHYYYGVVDNNDNVVYITSAVSVGGLNRILKKEDAKIQALFK